MKRLDLVEKRQYNFLGIEKDIMEAVKKIISDKEICKLLYFDGLDALDKDMTDEECAELFDKNYINIKSYFSESEEVKNFIIISTDNYTPTENNGFLDYTISITIYCHHENFNFKKNNETRIRDLYIANRIMELFNNKKLTSIGVLNFIGGSSVILGTDTEYSGKDLVFEAIHFNNKKEERIIDNNGDGFE